MNRFVLAALIGLLLAGCGGVRGTAATEAQVNGSPICEAIPHRGVPPAPRQSCPSPDGAWSVTYTGAYPVGTLWLSHHGSARVRAYKSVGLACCTNVTWAKPHTLLFDDDYQVFRLNPVTRTHKMIAGWSDFVVSLNGRWIAGYAYGGSSAAPALTVGVLSVDGKTCLTVPHGSHESDAPAGFSKDSSNVIIVRDGYLPGDG